MRRSPAAGKARVNKSLSSPKLGLAYGSFNCDHKITAPTKRDKIVPQATPAIPISKIKMATLEKRIFKALDKKLTYSGSRGLWVARIKAPKLVIKPKRTIEPPTNDR